MINVNAIRGPEALREWLLLSKPLHAGDNKSVIEMGQLVKGITTEEAKVAVVWAGAAPYFMDRYGSTFLERTTEQLPTRTCTCLQPELMLSPSFIQAI
jgi:hypothetical protein